jgi:hypothetical protein
MDTKLYDVIFQNKCSELDLHFSVDDPISNVFIIRSVGYEAYEQTRFLLKFRNNPVFPSFTPKALSTGEMGRVKKRGKWAARIYDLHN